LIKISKKKKDFSVNKSTTYLELYDFKTRSTRQLTYEKYGSDFSPMFHPERETVFFLSSRSGSTQIWAVDASIPNPTPQQISNIPIDVTSFKVSSTGESIVFSAQVYLDCPDLNCTAKRDAEIAARGENTGFAYESL
jgi:Tol biopolymer transport system component